MGKYVVLGHGGFNPTSSSYPPEVLVGTDTKLQFFSDAGQKLALPGGGDYTAVAGVWEQLSADGSPIEAKGVTYNYTLFPDATEGHRESAKSADWGSDIAVVFIDSRQVYLCQGTADTCPTPKLNVAAGRHDELLAKGDTAVKSFKEWLSDGASGDLPSDLADFAGRLEDVPAGYYKYVADGVPADRWKHQCDGILGQVGGSGNEVYWIACTSIMVKTPELPVLDNAAVRGPGASDDSDWIPTDDDYKAIKEANSKAVKDTADGDTVSIVAGGAVVLIGGGHLRRPANYVRRQTDIEEGQITVIKGGAFSKGTLQISGMSAKKTLIESEIGEFSDKKIKFV